MGKRMTKKRFIDKSNKIHNGYYGYDNVDFRLVIITCPEHGDFMQTTASHLQGSGCPHPSHRRKVFMTDAETFKIRAIQEHGDIYNYDKVIYTGSFNEVTITCPKHGDFRQTPNSHLFGSGCPICANELKSESAAEFIASARKVHGKFYNYDKVDYANIRTDVIITCPVHGDFKMSPREHLSGNECPSCGLKDGALMRGLRVLYSRDKFAIPEINKAFSMMYMLSIYDDNKIIESSGSRYIVSNDYSVPKAYR